MFVPPDASIAMSSQRLATLSADSRKLAAQTADAEARAEADAEREKETIAKLARANPEAMDNTQISELLNETQSK